MSHDSAEEKEEKKEDDLAADGSPESGDNDLNDEIAALNAKVEDFQQKYVGSLAEMENVRRIAKVDVDNAKTYAVRKFAKTMLGVADNLARATSSVPEDAVLNASSEMKALYEGVSMTKQELLKTFAANGIEQFGEVGDVFDPNRHDAMFQYDDPNGEPGTVGQVIGVGYTFKDRILRPAQVGTIKKPPEL